jgi:hypothetical protein
MPRRPSKKRQAPVTAEQIEPVIHLIRGQRIILDAGLARIYGVTTKRLNEQVKRNCQRFPADFMFGSHRTRQSPFCVQGRKLRPIQKST